MNNTINSISFGAKIITPLKGGYNVMDKVAKKFEEKTANMDGYLRVLKDGGTGLSVSLNDKKNVVFHDSSDLLLTNVKDDRVITDKVVDKIVDRFINVYRALNEYSKFEELKTFYRKKINEFSKNTYSSDRINPESTTQLVHMFGEFKNYKNEFLKNINEIVKDEPKLTIWKYKVLNDEAIK